MKRQMGSARGRLDVRNDRRLSAAVAVGVAILALGQVRPAMAQDANDAVWGVSHGNWTNSANWLQNAPSLTAGVYTYIDNGGTCVVDSATTSSQHLYLGGTISSRLQILTGGSVTLNGDLNIRGGSMYEVAGGTHNLWKFVAGALAGDSVGIVFSGGVLNPTIQTTLGRGDGSGVATFTQSGGTFYPGDYTPAVQIFSIYPGSTYNHEAGTVEVYANGSSVAFGIWGIYNLGNAVGTGLLKESATSSGNHVALTVHTNGILRGHGAVLSTLGSYAGTHIYQPLRNYGKIVADGHGVDRELSFPNHSSDKGGVVGGTNTTDRGWYAVNGGKLTLGALGVSSSFDAVTWGDTLDEATPSLVNSFRAAFLNVGGSGSLTASLLSTNRTDIPAWIPLSAKGAVAGVWTLAANGFSFDSASLAFRYDPALLHPTHTPTVYQFKDTAWANVASAPPDTTNRLAFADAQSLGMFAVVFVPPPSGTQFVIR